MSVSRRLFMASTVALGVAAKSSPAAAGAETKSPDVERWGVHELAFEGPDRGNPYLDVELSAVFESGAARMRVLGFYDGDGVYRIRFSPPSTGRWKWRTNSNQRALNGRSGGFQCIEPGEGNHGPVGVTPDGYHFAYADGTPYRQIGTTAYAWAQQSDAMCDLTLETLRNSPFNKMRMCVFPHVKAEYVYPFARIGEGPRDWDSSRPDPAFFQRFEHYVRALGALNIEADIILFEPYDKVRGYSMMSREDDERYLRYVIARLGAYRHVWWSMCNEFDVHETKKTEDWDHMFQIAAAADPFGRLLSIHPLYRYYDYRKPWVTHASIQNGSGVSSDIPAQIHRMFTEKAVIFDEAAYEGDLVAHWGNLSGEEMVERFWWGTIGGVYVGHGESYAPDGHPHNTFIARGGELVGSSPPRLAFLKKILEDAPTPGVEPIETWWSYHLGGKPFEYYLRYFGKERAAEWELILPAAKGDPLKTYRADIIDTWNMTVTPVDGVFKMAVRNENSHHDPMRPVIALPDKPYLAVRLVAVEG